MCIFFQMKWLYLFMLPLVSAQLDPVADLGTICRTDNAHIVNNVTYTSVVVYTCMCNEDYELTRAGTYTGVGSWTYNDQIEGISNSPDSNTFPHYTAQCTCRTGRPCDGCPDSTACNYNSHPDSNNWNSCLFADEYYDCYGKCLEDSDEDGICDELEITGCTDHSACNRNPQATDDDGSCNYPEYSYLDCDGKCLHDSDGDGICDELEIKGCMDPTACNYNENAEINDLCEYPPVHYDCEGKCENDSDDDGICDELEDEEESDSGNEVEDEEEVEEEVEDEEETDSGGEVDDVEDSDEVDACAKDEYVKNNTCKKCSTISENKAGDPVSGGDTSCTIKTWFTALMVTLGVAAVAMGVFLTSYFSQVRATRFIYDAV